MDHAKAWVPSPCILLIPSQTVHGFHFSEDVNGPVVTAAQRPLESLASVAMPELLPFLRKPAILPLDKAMHHDQSLMPLFTAIEREAQLSGAGQTSAGMALITALCIQLARLSPLAASEAPHRGTRKTAQIEKFRTLVNEDFKKHHPLTAYADQLGISPGQLSRLCREVLGVSSLDVINARLVHEAQRDLVYTTGSVKQVADSLGFTDETYFGRFFRKHTGTSPREFRAKALNDLAKAL